MIPIAGQVGLRKDFARGILSAEERAYAANAWDVVSDAKVAYVDFQRAQAKWRVLRAGITDLSRVESIVTDARRGRRERRLRPHPGRRRAKQARGPSRAERGRALHRTRHPRAAVGQSVDGRTVTVEDALDDAGDAPLLADLDALVKRALANRPDVGSARARADAGELRVELPARQVIPYPDLSIGYIRFIDAPGASYGRDGGAMLAGISFPIPILDHGQGTIDRGHALAAEDRARKDGVELAARREIDAPSRR